MGVCAATGVAGIHIGGSTVHSFLGCGKAETEQDGGGGFQDSLCFSGCFRDYTGGTLKAL